VNRAAPITSRSNARVKALRASFSGDARRPGEIVGIEGEHLIAELLRAELAPDTVFLREGSEDLLDRPSLAALSRRDLVVLSQDAFASAVDTASPQGIAATLAIPSVPFLEPRANFGMFLFLEDIQDPGNLGTLIRSAEAFGFRRVMTTPGTVNAWNPKTMRASAGSIFRVPVSVLLLSEFEQAMKQGGIKRSAAVVRGGNAIALDRADLHAPCAIMIGNEGAGLSAAALSASSERIHIPCATESLNAAIAGSILMWEAARQNAQLFWPGAL
jgi:TrmH family RNA methyltransferase